MNTRKCWRATRYGAKLIGRIINRLREEASLVPVKRTERVSPDPADDPFCACAKEGVADFMVTLNPRDFPQERLKARVIAPGDRLSKSPQSSKSAFRLPHSADVLARLLRV